MAKVTYHHPSETSSKLGDLLDKETCPKSLKIHVGAPWIFFWWRAEGKPTRTIQIVLKHVQINGAKHQCLSLGLSVEQVAGIWMSTATKSQPLARFNITSPEAQRSHQFHSRPYFRLVFECARYSLNILMSFWEEDSDRHHPFALR